MEASYPPVSDFSAIDKVDDQVSEGICLWVHTNHVSYNFTQSHTSHNIHSLFFNPILFPFPLSWLVLFLK